MPLLSQGGVALGLKNLSRKTPGSLMRRKESEAWTPHRSLPPCLIENAENRGWKKAMRVMCLPSPRGICDSRRRVAQKKPRSSNHSRITAEKRFDGWPRVVCLSSPLPRGGFDPRKALTGGEAAEVLPIRGPRGGLPRANDSGGDKQRAQGAGACGKRRNWNLGTRKIFNLNPKRHPKKIGIRLNASAPAGRDRS